MRHARRTDGRSVRATLADDLGEELTTLVALLGLLRAAACARSPMSTGHGKTFVGGYLVGSRGTAKHAPSWPDVTLDAPSRVFALGLVTLFASPYVRPRRSSPNQLASGAIVLAVA